MNTRRVGLTALVGAVFLAFVVDPALALNTGDTNTEQLIWGLNTWLLYLAIPITVLVEGILIYTVWKYRKNDEPQPTKENRRLEITWTVATAIILVAVGIGAFTVLAEPAVTASSNQAPDSTQEPLEIQVEGQKYAWTYTYPNETVKEVTGVNESISRSSALDESLVMPTDRPVVFNVTSADWLHAFHVPEMGLKSDAFPGQYNQIRTTAKRPGNTYQLYCAEYCGQGHSQMLGTVETKTEANFQSWLASQTSANATAAGNASGS